jgi:hypothetical protein
VSLGVEPTTALWLLLLDVDGLDDREPARLLLDAKPDPGTPPSTGSLFRPPRDVPPPPGVTLGPGERWVREDAPVVDAFDLPRPAKPGDPAAREALNVLADKLLDDGDPRGEWLALWLDGPETFASVLGDIEAALRRLAPTSMTGGRHSSAPASR